RAGDQRGAVRRRSQLPPPRVLRRPRADRTAGVRRGARPEGRGVPAGPVAAGRRAGAEGQGHRAVPEEMTVANTLQGKVVAVTGASAGVGRAAAVAFGAQGASVALLARGNEGLE